MRSFEKITFEQFKNDITDDRSVYDNYLLPKRKTASSAGYDFLAINDFAVKPGEIVKIPTGVKAKFADDEFLMLVVRSSMGFKYNIRLCNQVGIIDSDFYGNSKNEGHIWISLKNEGDQVYNVKKGEGFCQGIFLKYLTCGDDVETKRDGWSWDSSIDKDVNKEEN